jgi:N-methylhydantoinase A/oxoprolinase/acetone carboxylase beta subunit
VVHLGNQLDDARVAAECGRLNLLASEQLPNEQTASVEVYADVRFRGQSHELKVRVRRPNLASIEAAFRDAYEKQYGRCPEGRAVEVVTLRLRRVGHVPDVSLPILQGAATRREFKLIDARGSEVNVIAVNRAALAQISVPGPLLVIDAEATTFVPEGWVSTGDERGWVVLTRR